MVRVWWDNGVFNTDSGNYLPFYMERLELGQRAFDYLNGPAEEQMLEDMINCHTNTWHYSSARVVCANSWPNV